MMSNPLEVMTLTVFTPSKQWGSFAFQSLQFVLIFNRKHYRQEAWTVFCDYSLSMEQTFFFFFLTVWEGICECNSLFYPPEGRVVLKCPWNFIYREMFVLEPVFERRWWRMLVTMSPHIYQQILDRIAISLCLPLSSLDKQRLVVK